MGGQCVILCGGLGTRLGPLTAATPKPLLEVAGRPWLELLLDEVGAQGVCEVLLLAGVQAAEVQSFAAGSRAVRAHGLKVQVVAEPAPAGTGGALWRARDQLADCFLLLNGDSWLDAPLDVLAAALRRAPQALGAVALRRVADAGRFGRVELSAGHISRFAEKTPQAGPGLINAGVYALRRAVVERLAPVGSLERDLFPQLAQARQLLGRVFNGYFIDIGVPASFERAQHEVRAQLRDRRGPPLARSQAR